MTYGGFLEARLTLSSGLTASWTDSSGTATVTVPAGNYYPRELASTLQTQIQGLAGLIGDGATVTISTAETTPGRCTIAAPGTFSLTWTSTDLRDALGFASSIVSQTSATGTKVCRGMWFPGVAHRFSRYGQNTAPVEQGDLITDYRATVGPTGTVHAIYSTQHRRHRGIRWDGTPGYRSKEHHELVIGESFEAFARDCMTGRFALIPVNPYVKLYWTTTVGPTTVGRLLWPAVFEMQTLITGWSGRYVVSLPELVEESA